MTQCLNTARIHPKSQETAWYNTQGSDETDYVLYPYQKELQNLLSLFGFASCFLIKLADDAPLTDIVGTSYYVAPEVLEGRYSLPADVWSAGVILHIMLVSAGPRVMERFSVSEQFECRFFPMRRHVACRLRCVHVCWRVQYSF